MMHAMEPTNKDRDHYYNLVGLLIHCQLADSPEESVRIKPGDGAVVFLVRDGEIVQAEPVLEFLVFTKPLKGCVVDTYVMGAATHEAYRDSGEDWDAVVILTTDGRLRTHGATFESWKEFQDGLCTGHPSLRIG